MKISNNLLATFSHFKNYFTANIATKAIGFISIPIFTRLLTPEDYGIINLFNSYVSILVVLLTLNFQSSISRYFYEEKDDFSSFLTLSLIGGLILFIINSSGLILANYIYPDIINLPEELFLLLFLVVLFRFFSSIFSQVYTPQLKSKLIAKTSIIQAYSSFILAIIIILSINENKYKAVIYASAFIGLLFLIYYIFMLRKYFLLDLKKLHLKYIVNYSIPLIPYALSGVILSQIDRIMISNIHDYEETGLYSFAYNIGILLLIITISINTAWTPKFFKYMKEKQYRIHEYELDIIISIIFIAAIGLVLFGKELGMILAKNNYYDSLNIVPLIVLGYVFQSIFAIYGRNIGYSKKTYYSTVIYLFAGILNIVLNAITIPKYGYQSAALNTTISFLVLAILSYITSKYILKIKSFPISYILNKVIVVIFAVFAFYFIENNILNFGLKILVKILILGSTTFLVYLLTKKNQSRINEDVI